MFALIWLWMRFRVDFYFIIFLDLIAFDKVILIKKVDLVVCFTSFRLFWVLILIKVLITFQYNRLIFRDSIRKFLMFRAGVLLIGLNQYCLWFIWSILICISNWYTFLRETLATCFTALSIIIIKITLIIIPINTCL